MTPDRLEAGITETVQVGPHIAQPVDAELEVLGELAEQGRRLSVRAIGKLGDDPVGPLSRLDEVQERVGLDHHL